MIRFSSEYFQHARDRFIRILLLFPAVLLLSCGSVDEGDSGGSNVVKSTNIPIMFNGEDSGYRILVFLANYSESVIPSFGPDGDAQISENGGTLTVRFHPTHRYNDTGGHGAPDQYFLYVGLIAPPLSVDPAGNVYPGGMSKRKSIKGENVNFTGEFRFESGNVDVRKHFYLTPTLIYYRLGQGDYEYKQIAFNDYGGLQGKNSDTMYFDFVEFSWASGWHNVYYGDWWNDAICAPDPNDPAVPSDWIPFDMSLSDLSDKAVALGNSMWNYREAPDTYFNTDEIEIWAAYLGPEYKIGEGELVFSVRNLNLSFSPR